LGGFDFGFCSFIGFHSRRWFLRVTTILPGCVRLKLAGKYKFKN